MAFAGIDRLAYPGNEFMKGLISNTNLLWTGFYLAPAPSQPNTSWMTHVADLRAMDPGWGIAPIFVGQQHPSGPGSHILTAAQGRQDAQLAAQLADQAGFRSGSETSLPGDPTIYLDIEIGGNLPSNLLSYANAWCDEIRRNTPYAPAVYCSFQNTAAQLLADNPDLVVWVFNINQFLHHHDQAFPAPNKCHIPDPAQSGFPQATAWQWIQSFASITTTLPNGSIRTLNNWDLDASDVPDPSHPSRKSITPIAQGDTNMIVPAAPGGDHVNVIVAGKTKLFIGCAYGQKVELEQLDFFGPTPSNPAPAFTGVGGGYGGANPWVIESNRPGPITVPSGAVQCVIRYKASHGFTVGTA